MQCERHSAGAAYSMEVNLFSVRALRPNTKTKINTSKCN